MNGRAGLRFREVPLTRQKHLESWLDEQLEEELPGAKEKIASAGPETLQ